MADAEGKLNVRLDFKGAINGQDFGSWLTGSVLCPHHIVATTPISGWQSEETHWYVIIWTFYFEIIADCKFVAKCACGGPVASSPSFNQRRRLV